MRKNGKTMKINQSIKIASIALLAMPLVLASTSVNAGLRGQKLRIDTGSGSGPVRVEGLNQDYRSSIWRSSGAGITETHGHWWNGNAHIYVTKGNRIRRCLTAVPLIWFSDWWFVDCRL